MKLESSGRRTYRTDNFVYFFKIMCVRFVLKKSFNRNMVLL